MPGSIPRSTTRLRPVFGWLGGKHNLKKILRSIVKKQLFSGTYFEPFCGAGNVLLKLQPKKARLNDINPYLMLVFQVLKLIPSTFIQTLETLQRPSLPIKVWYRQVLVDFNANQQHAIPHALSELTKEQLNELLLPTARFYFLVKFSYGGIIKFTNSGILYSSCRHEKWEEPLYDQDLFLAIHQHLSANNVEFFHGDYSRLIENCKADDLVFFDLPYYNTNCKFLYSTDLFDADAWWLQESGW